MNDVQLPVRRGFTLTGFRPGDARIVEKLAALPEISANIATISDPAIASRAREWFHRLPMPAQSVARLLRDLTIAHRNTRNTESKPGLLLIRNAVSEPIGAIGSNASTVHGSGTAELGCWIAKAYWGQGIMTDAMRAYVHYAFNELYLHKVSAHMVVSNLAAVRLVEKVGFKREGYLRQQYVRDGQCVDAYLYGLVKDDLTAALNLDTARPRQDA